MLQLLVLKSKIQIMTMVFYENASEEFQEKYIDGDIAKLKQKDIYQNLFLIFCEIISGLRVKVNLGFQLIKLDGMRSLKFKL